MTQLREAQEKYKASVSPSNRPPKLTRDDDVSLTGSAELDITSVSASSDPRRRSMTMAATVRQAWLSRVPSDQLRSSTESIASRETRITHVGSVSDESLNGNNNNGDEPRTAAAANGRCCRLADSGNNDKQCAHAYVAPTPRSGSQLSLPPEEKTDSVLSPHAKRLSRLKAIREKSQSLDAIYI